jgi:hypothetical protein
MKLSSRHLTLVIPLFVFGCAEALPEKIDLAPEADKVEFAQETPSSNAWKMIGKVKGIAAAKDPDQATQAARNDIRNKAAALGATLLKIDEDVGEGMQLEGKTKVTITGRAYKPAD